MPAYRADLYVTERVSRCERVIAVRREADSVEAFLFAVWAEWDAAQMDIEVIGEITEAVVWHSRDGSHAETTQERKRPSR